VRTCLAILARLLPGRLAFWALRLGREPANDAVGDFQLFFELVVLEDEIAIAIDDTISQPIVNAFTIDAVVSACGAHVMPSLRIFETISDLSAGSIGLPLGMVSTQSFHARGYRPVLSMVTDYNLTGLDCVLIIWGA